MLETFLWLPKVELKYQLGFWKFSWTYNGWQCLENVVLKFYKKYKDGLNKNILVLKEKKEFSQVKNGSSRFSDIP